MFNNISQLTTILKATVALSIISLLLYFADVQTLRHHLNEAIPLYVVLGTLSFLMGQMIASYRWYYVLKHEAGMQVSKRSIYKVHLAALCASNFLPGQASGDVVKATLLFKNFQEQKAFLLASVLFDRLVGLVTIVLLGILITFYTGSDYLDMGNINLLSILIAIVFSVLIVRKFQISLLLLNSLKKLLGSAVKRFSKEFVNLISNLRLVSIAILLSVLFQLSWAICLYLMLKSLMVDLPFYVVMLGTTLSVFVAILPISLGGIGVREGAFTLIMTKFGVEYTVATTAAILSLVPIVIASLFGALILNNMAFNFKHSTYMR